MMTEKDPMPFGKHRDEKIGDVPASYLLWFYSCSWAKEKYPDLYDYVARNVRLLTLCAKEEEEDDDFGYSELDFSND